jgi:uncharacterized membrane protein YccC
MPAMFALADKVLGEPQMATFASFGSFAMLLLVDFGGPVRARLQEEAALAVVGAVFIGAGTLASRPSWLAAAAMALVGFAVLFAGVISSVLSAASTSLLLAFILPVTLAAPASAVPDRLAGWAMAAAASLLAVGVLWPAPARDPLRPQVSAACRALAERLRADVELAQGQLDGPEHAERVSRASAAVAALRSSFFATPYRPTALSTGARAVVRLIDELMWLDAVLAHFPSSPHPGGGGANPHQGGGDASSRAKVAAASVLENGVELLDAPGVSPAALVAALADMRTALAAVEQGVLAQPVPKGAGAPWRAQDIISALDPSFRAQELSFAVSQVAANIALAAAADARSWWQRVLGHQPAGLPSTLSAARQRAFSHLERHSVWLHNSVRGGAGLGLAVLVADLTGVQHSFWVVLGALSVLRSNALNTGHSALRGLIGTAIGFVAGAGLIAVLGAQPTRLWLVLPFAVFVAGVAPSVISFAAGQAAFTVVLVVLFNIVEPAGWRVGLVRVEDIAIGCAVSLAVGALFWPRGAAGALGDALAEAYADSARYLGAAVTYGVGRGSQATSPGPAPGEEALRSAAAARRLDDTFRSYLAERGAKPAALAEVTALVTGVVALRLAAAAVTDLWRPDGNDEAGGAAVAGQGVLDMAAAVVGWYLRLSASFGGRGEVPAKMPADAFTGAELAEALRHDLTSPDSHLRSTAVRMVWTADHLDAVRRLQGLLVGPALAANG